MSGQSQYLCGVGRKVSGQEKGSVHIVAGLKQIPRFNSSFAQIRQFGEHLTIALLQAAAHGPVKLLLAPERPLLSLFSNRGAEGGSETEHMQTAHVAVHESVVETEIAIADAGPKREPSLANPATHMEQVTSVVLHTDREPGVDIFDLGHCHRQDSGVIPVATRCHLN